MQEPEQLSKRLDSIRAEKDPNRKNLLVAEIVSEAFREIGCDPVVVGGSAVEFYTDGQYVSGDVDICQAGPKFPTQRQREEVMSKLGTSLGGIRKWNVCGVFVDILGSVETSARTPFREMGGVKLIQIEDLIAERILIATAPAPNEQRLGVARMLLSVAASGLIQADFNELQRVAECADYRVGKALNALLEEIEAERRLKS